MQQLHWGKATLEHLKIPGLCNYVSRWSHIQQNDRLKIIISILKHQLSMLNFDSVDLN